MKMIIECPSCKGTGVYVGMATGEGTAVICNKCNGTGAYEYKYEKFTGKKIKEGIQRVYVGGSRYKIYLGKIDYGGIGIIDMNKEGVSYSEFLDGKIPTYTKKLGCPLITDQIACQNIKGFTEECDKLNGELIHLIPKCKYQIYKDKCWERFEKKHIS